MFTCISTCVFQYESQDIRELNLIYAGQNVIRQSIHDLNVKLDNLMSRNDRIATQIDAVRWFDVHR